MTSSLTPAGNTEFHFHLPAGLVLCDHEGSQTVNQHSGLSSTTHHTIPLSHAQAKSHPYSTTLTIDLTSQSTIDLTKDSGSESNTQLVGYPSIYQGLYELHQAMPEAHFLYFKGHLQAQHYLYVNDVVDMPREVLRDEFGMPDRLIGMFNHHMQSLGCGAKEKGKLVSGVVGKNKENYIPN